MTVKAVAALLADMTEEERDIVCDCEVRFSVPDNTLAALCTSGMIYIANDTPIHRCESLTKDDEFDAFAMFVTLMPLIEQREVAI